MRSLALLGVLMISALVGCIDDGPHSSVNAGDPVGNTLVDRWSLVSDDRGVGEPSLGRTPEGHWFTNIGASNYRSLDDGVSWEDLGSPTVASTFDPDLAVDMDGTVWESRLYIACNTVASSQDLGDTWQVGAGCPGVVGDRQYIIPTHGGTAYLYWNSFPEFRTTIIRTDDHGLTWSPERMFDPAVPEATVAGVHVPMGGLNEHAPDSNWGGGGFYDPVLDTVYLSLTGNFEDGLAPMMLAKERGGEWEIRKGPLMQGDRVGLSLVTGAADDEGRVYLSWAEGNWSGDSSGAVYVASSDDQGRTWSEAVRIDEGPGVDVFPSIVVTGDRIAVAFYGADGPGNPNADTMTWHVMLAWAMDLEGPWQRASLQEDPVKTGPLYVSGSGGNSGREFLDYLSAVATPDGRVAVVHNLMEGTDPATLRNRFVLTHPLPSVAQAS